MYTHVYSFQPFVFRAASQENLSTNVIIVYRPRNFGCWGQLLSKRRNNTKNCNITVSLMLEDDDLNHGKQESCAQVSYQ